MNENILIAHASDGMRRIFKKEVSLISVWINGRCEHRVDDESVAALLKEAKKTNKMQIYICDNNKLDGNIDAFGCTPLYTNGQVNIDELIYNGTVIWSRFSRTFK